MKNLILSCLSMMLCMTISAQTVSFVPNWKKGDKVSFNYEKKETKKSGDETSIITASLVINLTVVNKDANGYTLNASFANPKQSGSDKMAAALFKIYDEITFDYKLDATGKLIGLADSAKVIAVMKEIYKKISKDDPMVSLGLGLMGGGAQDIYLTGLLDEIALIHSLNGITLEPNKTVEVKKEISTSFGFNIPASYNYTLESAKGTIANVKCSSNLTNEDIMPAFIDFGTQIASSMMNNLSALFQNEEDKEKVDMNTIIQQQRGEFEKKYKESFDLNITDTFNYALDSSSKWLNSLSGTSTISGKAENNDVNVVTEIKITKK